MIRPADRSHTEVAALKFLLVCAANVCRSPMAEAAMRHAVAARGLRPEVGSAGVAALRDEPADPRSIEAVARAGLGDLSTHRSRPVSGLLVRTADMVLCMEQAQRTTIVARTPEAAGRVRLLGHWQGMEIADPVGGEAHEYVQCLDLIMECVDQWLERLSRQGLLQ